MITVQWRVDPTQSNLAAYLYAVLVLVGATVLFHLVSSRPQRRRPGGKAGPSRYRRGMWALVVGLDGRTSTSKLQLATWTYVVLWALFALLFMGTERLAQAFNTNFEAEYLVLLGAPATAAVVAKHITATRVATGELSKPPATDGGLSARLAEVVTDDKGRGDLGDFQYFLFNLLAVAYVLLGFVRAPLEGLPSIPPTLVALTGVSALTYMSKKGLERQTPRILSVLPLEAAPGETLTVRGTDFLVNDDDRTQVRVLLGTCALSPDSATPSTITVKVPAGAPEGEVPVRVYSATGVPSTEDEPKTIKIVPAATPSNGRRFASRRDRGRLPQPLSTGGPS